MKHYYTFFRKNCDTKFVVKNISASGKRIRIFNYPIVSGETRDLLAIPEISEAVIRHSLLKGELVNKLRAEEIFVIDSNIDLLQFDQCHKEFLRSRGVRFGLSITASEIATLGFEFRTDVELVGTKDGVNKVFTTPDKFVDGLIERQDFHIQLFHNGLEQTQNIDFTISESGGAGTGFDTITFITFAPLSDSCLTANYVIEA